MTMKVKLKTLISSFVNDKITTNFTRSGIDYPELGKYINQLLPHTSMPDLCYFLPYMHHNDYIQTQTVKFSKP